MASHLCVAFRYLNTVRSHMHVLIQLTEYVDVFFNQIISYVFQMSCAILIYLTCTYKQNELMVPSIWKEFGFRCFITSV